MASFEFVAIILTGLGLTASLVYYASVLRNTNKTQMIFAIQGKRGTKEGLLRYVNVLKLEWQNFDDFNQKYGFDKNPEKYDIKISEEQRTVLEPKLSYEVISGLTQKKVVRLKDRNIKRIERINKFPKSMNFFREHMLCMIR